jgi:hypothetical protein
MVMARKPVCCRRASILGGGHVFLFISVTGQGRSQTVIRVPALLSIGPPQSRQRVRLLV